MLKQILTFIYPKLCYACDRELRHPETHVCLHCQEDIPVLSEEHQHHNNENRVLQLFWGKSEVDYATSCFLYVKGEKLQTLIHELKYKGAQDLAKYFGKIMSDHFAKNENFKEVKAICYVPSNKQKIKNRGYNQAEKLASVISSQTSLPCLNLLIKKKETDSQTSKSVHDRHLNLDKSFSINPKSKLPTHCYHVLLIDDVITSGATLNACANTLRKQLNLKVSVLTLAFRDI